MNTAIHPQPQKWCGYWLWLNMIYTTNELMQRLDWQWSADRHDVAWHWRIVAEPKPIKRKVKQ